MLFSLSQRNIYLSRLLVILFLFAWNSFGLEKEKVENVSEPEKAETLFRRLYKMERIEQLVAVKALLKIGSEEKQIKMVQAIADKVFTVIRKSQRTLDEAGYVAGVSSFPSNEKTRDALSNVLENTAFFGDILMRLPDITEDLLKNNTEWNSLLQWCLKFATQTKLLDGKTNVLVNLVGQEMNFTKRKSNFTNPYRKLQMIIKTTPVPEVVKKKVKKKKTLPRGPRLSGSYNAEL